MADPFIKWPGGKAKKAARIGELLPSDFAQRPYVEPMVGGGAIFFAHGTRAKSAVLADVNVRLIQAYTGVRDSPDEVADLLYSMPVSRKEYDVVRDQFNACMNDGLSPAQIAALLIYLNKTCFNGVYRENASGGFNVPYGDNRLSLMGTPFAGAVSSLRGASRSLQGVDLRHGSVIKALQWCPSDAFVYFDPPYVTKGEHETGGGFTAYSAGGFSETDLKVLSRVAKTLSDTKGCKVMISHSDVAVARRAFDWMNKAPAVVDHTVSQSGRGRGAVAEILFTSY